MGLQTSQEPETRAMLVGNIVYTQGLPIIISIITALVDSFGSCDSIIPNMGYFSCFLGSEFDPEKNFGETPQFLYFYMIISVILLVNIVCFIITAYYLTKHWRAVQQMQTSIRNSFMTHMW